MNNKKVKDWTALLTINEVPRTKESEKQLTDWLKNIIKEIRKSDPDIFAKPCRFRLMK